MRECTQNPNSLTPHYLAPSRNILKMNDNHLLKDVDGETKVTPGQMSSYKALWLLLKELCGP